jgi:uncharacterized membrane protein
MSQIEILPNLHPIFVHFTVALFLISTLLFIVGAKNKKYRKLIYSSAYVNLWLGFIITIITVIMGFYAYYTVAHDGPSHAAMTDHRNWALITFIAFSIPFIWSIINYRNKSHKNIIFILLLIFASSTLLIAAYKGGEVVYRYGIGVKSLPEVNSDGGHKSHSHGKERLIEETFHDDHNKNNH